MPQSKSYILISNSFENEVARLQKELLPNRVVSFIREEFLIEDAKALISEAYISESETKYIVAAASKFSQISQNSLLKILEEPPRNIEFIIICESKSSLLPTVRSRLPIIKGEVERKESHLELNLSRLDYEQIFEFLKHNAKLTKIEAQEMVEALYHRAVVVDRLILNEAQLNNFDLAYRLLELNARTNSIFALILMGFMSESSHEML